MQRLTAELKQARTINTAEKPRMTLLDDGIHASDVQRHLKNVEAWIALGIDSFLAVKTIFVRCSRIFWLVRFPSHEIKAMPISVQAHVKSNRVCRVNAGFKTLMNCHVSIWCGVVVLGHGCDVVWEEFDESCFAKAIGCAAIDASL